MQVIVITLIKSLIVVSLFQSSKCNIIQKYWHTTNTPLSLFVLALVDHMTWFDFIECFKTTFLRAHSWLNWVNEDDDEVGLKEKPEDTRYI